MQPISISNAEHYIWGGQCDGWHLLKNTGLSVIQERVPAGAGEIRHFHTYAQQFFYVLSGAATIEFDEIAHQLGVHEGLHVPPNTPHRFVNNGDGDVVFLVISTPPSAGDRINL